MAIKERRGIIYHAVLENLTCHPLLLSRRPAGRPVIYTRLMYLGHLRSVRVPEPEGGPGCRKLDSHLFEYVSLSFFLSLFFLSETCSRMHNDISDGPEIAVNNRQLPREKGAIVTEPDNENETAYRGVMSR